VHQDKDRSAVLLDQCKAEILHVVEMPVERRRRNARQLRDFAQAERIETAARGQFPGRCSHQFLARFCFLLLSRNLQVAFLPVTA
jgi:hypothetical protein